MATVDPSAVTALGRIAGRLRAQGPLAVLAKAWGDHVYSGITSVILEYRPEWRTVARGDVRPDWLDLRFVSHVDDLPPLDAWLAWRRPAFVAMLASDRIAALALDRGRVIGCVWIALADHEDRSAGEFYRVAPGEAYHYCTLVHPDYRTAGRRCRSAGS